MCFKSILSITVTFNPDIFILEKQINSLIDQVDNLIFVDNGSSNVKEIKVLLAKHDLSLVELKENIGLAAAQNIGIEHAINTGAEYFILLDQDSVLDDDFVSKMYKVYVNNDVDILGPSFYDPVSNNTYPGTNYIGPFIKRSPIGELTYVTYVISSGSFFSKDVFYKAGKMKEELFVDYIDVEWSIRAKSLGLKVAMTNQASMSHTIGDSRCSILGRQISVHSPMRRYFLIRNSFLMLRTSYIPIGYKIRETIFNSARFILSLILNKNKKETLIKSYQGFLDGINGKFGKYNH